VFRIQVAFWIRIRNDHKNFYEMKDPDLET
jgi:hypothetical protein